MAYDDLRAFIERLEAEGELVRITAPVSAALEITEITDRVSKGPAAHNKALLFENVTGYSIPVLINAFGSAQRMAWALGVDDLEDLRRNLAKIVDPKLPKGMSEMMKRGGDMLGVLRSIGFGPSTTRRAACQEIVIDENPSLDMLPILTCWPEDGGPYITLPQVITRDPVTGQRNVGMNRLQKIDGQTLMMHWQRHKGGADHEREARKHQLAHIPCAIVLGGDPAQMWCSSAPLPPGIDEYLLASWLRGKPVPFVKAITQDIEVPANAEIVIEGYVDPNEHQVEGPFGDHTGFYTPADLFPVFHVTAITHKRGAIYPATVVGKPPMEDAWMGKATERLFLPLLQLFQGEITDYNMPAEGGFHNLVILSAPTRYPGHAQKLMYAVWAIGLMMLSKAVIVVDPDVDVHDRQAVADAVLRNVDWRRDITVVDGPVDQLDHSAIQDSYGGKIGIDATRKADREYDTAPANADALNEIDGMHWSEPLPGLLLVRADKTGRAARDIFEMIWNAAPEHSIVLLDDFVDLGNLPDVAWRTLGNVDWRRDIVIRGGPVDPYTGDDQAPRGQIGIDATTKTAADGHPRGWPVELEMRDDIKRLVDDKWSQYGI